MSRTAEYDQEKKDRALRASMRHTASVDAFPSHVVGRLYRAAERTLHLPNGRVRPRCGQRIPLDLRVEGIANVPPDALRCIVIHALDGSVIALATED